MMQNLKSIIISLNAEFHHFTNYGCNMVVVLMKLIDELFIVQGSKKQDYYLLQLLRKNNFQLP